MKVRPEVVEGLQQRFVAVEHSQEGHVLAEGFVLAVDEVSLAVDEAPAEERAQFSVAFAVEDDGAPHAVDVGGHAEGREVLVVVHAQGIVRGSVEAIDGDACQEHELLELEKDDHGRALEHLVAGVRRVFAGVPLRNGEARPFSAVDVELHYADEECNLLGGESIVKGREVSRFVGPFLFHI